MSFSITKILDDWFYPDTARNWDDLRFADRIRNALSPNHRLLEYGAGRGHSPVFDFRGNVAEVVGVDIDKGILENPYVHQKVVFDPLKGLPFEDNYFDVIFACNVLEHVGDPRHAMAEIGRVLRPGGFFLGKTPNKNHYVALVSRCTPLWFHKYFNRLRGRDEQDTFPTVYRCNSKRQLARTITGTDLAIDATEFWEWRPEYLRINLVSYVPGIVYERLVNSTRLLEYFRAVMFCRLRKNSAENSKPERKS